ncbi:MAG: hypothetical protein R2748_03430 [Bryobacterales bacterium]
MDVIHLSLPAGKAEFNFEEAAAALGISSNELETLVAERLNADGPSVRNLARMRFRPADLIMLNMVQAARAGVPVE